MKRVLKILGAAAAAITLLALFGVGVFLFMTGAVLSGAALIQAGFYGLELAAALGQLLLGVLGMLCGGIVCLWGTFVISWAQSHENERKLYES